MINIHGNSRSWPARQSGLLLIGGLFLACAALAADGVELSLERGSFEYEARKLNFFCAGQGQPTLILEAPSGISNEEAFSNVLPNLISISRVCAYERAAYGGSEELAPGVVQTIDDYASELHAFLENGGVEPPFVLLGFSYGGFVSRYYTAHHPDDIAGMVLIDSPHVEWLRTMKVEMTQEDWAKIEDIMQWFRENRGHDVWESQFQVEAAPALPSQLPVVVITRGLDHQRIRLSGISDAGFRIFNDIHFRLAPRLLTLTDRTRAISADQSEHMVPDSEPEVVIKAVNEVLAMINKDRKHQAPIAGER